MKNKFVAFILVAGAVLAFSDVAFAEIGQAGVKVISSDTLNKFRKHTVDLREQLKAKNLELYGIYAYDSIDSRRVDELEQDITEIKVKIRSVAASMNIELCNCL
jgi:sugar phosphate isomerase/epimerase